MSTVRAPHRGDSRPAAERLLPHRWRGPGREARWRRGRARRLVAGLLAGAAVLAVVGALRPPDPGTHPVLVATRDLPAGTRLRATDVEQTRWSVTASVPGAVSVGRATGRVLTAPVRAGEPITDSRTRTPRRWPALPAGKVLVGVPSSDAALLRVLQPGDRVDLLDPAKGVRLASRAAVVLIPPATAAQTPAFSRSVTDPTSVLVALTPSEARAVAAANAVRAAGVGGGVQLALHAAA